MDLIICQPFAIFLHSDRSVLYAALWFHDFDDILNIWDDIEKSCNDKQFDSLHLGCEFAVNQLKIVNTFNKIRHFSCIKSVHFRNLIVGTISFKNVPVQSYLKTLCFGIWNDIDDKFSKQIVKLFPNLNELYICIGIQNIFIQKHMLITIASKLRMLKRLHFLNYLINLEISNDDLMEMNLARLNLKDASFLEIRIRSWVTAMKLEIISIKTSHFIEMKCPSCKVLSLGLQYYHDDDNITSLLKTLPITV